MVYHIITVSRSHGMYFFYFWSFVHWRRHQWFLFSKLINTFLGYYSPKNRFSFDENNLFFGVTWPIYWLKRQRWEAPPSLPGCPDSADWDAHSGSPSVIAHRFMPTKSNSRLLRASTAWAFRSCTTQPELEFQKETTAVSVFTLKRSGGRVIVWLAVKFF